MNIGTLIAMAANGLLTMAALELWNSDRKAIAISLVFPFILVAAGGVLFGNMLS